MTGKTRSKTISDKISIRFGDEMMEEGFTTLPNLVLNTYAQLGISHSQMLFIIHVWQYWWTERNPYPSLGSIAERMAVDRRRVRAYSEALKTIRYDEYPDLRLLVIRDRFSPHLGQTTNEFDFSGFFKAILLANKGKKMTPRTKSSEGGRTKSSEAPRTESSYKEDEELRKQVLNNHSNIRKSTRSNDDFLGKSVSQPISSTVKVNHGIEGIGEIMTRDRGRPLDGYTTPAPVEQSSQTNGEKTAKPKRGRPRKYVTQESQAIVELARDFGREFSDNAPVASSAARLENLFTRWGKGDMNEYLGLLYQAKAITRSRNGIKGSKFAYFCTVVEDLLGLKDDTTKPISHV